MNTTLIHRIPRRVVASALFAVASSAFFWSAASHAADAPTVIRIGSPDLGTAGKPSASAGPLTVVQSNKWLEQEFAKDGIKVEWNFFRGAGPAIAEGLAAKQLDVVFLGDLASVKSGYQRFFGNYGGAIDYFTHKPGVGEAVPRDLYEGEVPVERVGYYTQLLADEASAWIGEQSADILPGIYATDGQVALLPDGGYQIEPEVGQRLDEAVDTLILENLSGTLSNAGRFSPVHFSQVRCSV